MSPVTWWVLFGVPLFMMAVAWVGLSSRWSAEVNRILMTIAMFFPTAADNATVRTVFVVGPDKKIKLQLAYPMSTGRNFDEILRVIDSMQLTAKHKVATPVNWKQGEEVIILPSVSNEEAQQKYPGGWKSPKPYLRIVPQPK
jgi:hypothetical protein